MLADFLAAFHGAQSLLPPLVAITLAVLFRRVLEPLAMGVFTGAVLLALRDDGFPWQVTNIFYQGIYDSVTDDSHLKVLLFSLLLGAMVGVLEAGGGIEHLIQKLARRIRSRKGGQLFIASSGLAIFFDDYANTLLVGGTMRSSADRYGISREKLAYLVDSTAAPIAGLSIVSTWAATEISYMAEGLAVGGIDDPSAAFEMFLQSIPYRFYPWLALAMVFLVGLRNRDFGPMRAAEAKAIAEHKQLAPPNHQDQSPERERPADQKSDKLWLAGVLPLMICVASVAIILVATGISELSNDSELAAQWSERGWLRKTIMIFGNGDSYAALIRGGAAGLVTALGLHRWIGKSPLSLLSLGALKGAWQMMPAMMILWLAWALSAMTEPEQLNTGGYLASILSERLSPPLLPSIVFVLAGGMAFATGTSWGTMAILTPLSIGLALQLDPTSGPSGAIALATCGSVLAGAIFGDHCSPISDTTVLSSRASGCDHLAHVNTQLPYALVAGGASVAFGTLPAAYGVSPWICLPLGIITLFFALALWGKPYGESESQNDTTL